MNAEVSSRSCSVAGHADVAVSRCMPFMPRGEVGVPGGEVTPLGEGAGSGAAVCVCVCVCVSVLCVCVCVCLCVCV